METGRDASKPKLQQRGYDPILLSCLVSLVQRLKEQQLLLAVEVHLSDLVRRCIPQIFLWFGLIQGDSFHWYPPEKLKCVKPGLGESTLT